MRGAPGGEDWRPAAELPTLRLRARLLAELRRFFEARGVLEVETPVLGAATATAPHLESLQAAGPDGRPAGWLQTSPEYAMKRLLAAHGAAIYQVARAFRAGERGSRHNPEFTLVEWYRPGLALDALMDEVVALVGALLGERRAPRRHRYGALLAGRAGVDAFASPTEALAEAAGSLGIVLHGGLDRDGLLDLLWSHGVQPHLGHDGPALVTGFPASQAALARVDPGPPPVALRCELYLAGMELANGYQEETDAEALRGRWEADRALRRDRGQPVPEPDLRLLAAQEAGLPECAGVALGFDRLVMLAAGASRLEQVLAFPADRA